MTEPAALAGIGHNLPPLAQTISSEEDLPAQVVIYLDDEYSRIPRTVDELLAEARALPQAIDDDQTMGLYAKLIKRLRDLTKEIESHHAKEKAPYLRSSQAVDNWFFSLWSRCARRQRADKPGAADVLQARLDDYNQRKLLAEQERRRKAAEEAARNARAAAEKAERERREAEEARLAAERARKVETIAAKGAVAAVAAEVASVSANNAALAEAHAEQAHIDTLARPADMIRTRVDEGPTVTMATEPYAIVEDEELLDMAKLWPFVKSDEKARALRAWAKTTNFNQQMAGAKIGRKPKSVVR